MKWLSRTRRESSCIYEEVGIVVLTLQKALSVLDRFQSRPDQRLTGNGWWCRLHRFFLFPSFCFINAFPASERSDRTAATPFPLVTSDPVATVETPAQGCQIERNEYHQRNDEQFHLSPLLS